MASMRILNTLYVTTPESRMQLANGMLRVELEGEARLRVPMHHPQAVVCARAGSWHPPRRARLTTRERFDTSERTGACYGEP
jgi:hypothetical protein